MCIATSTERLCAQLTFASHRIKTVIAVSTTVLVFLQFIFMVWEIVFVTSAWGYLYIKLFR